MTSSEFRYFPELPQYAKYEILLRTPPKDFPQLCLTNKETKEICSGNLSESTKLLYGNNITERLYTDRAERWFGKELFEYKELNMSAREFYNRIVKFYEEFNSEQETADFSNMYLKEGKLMELKLLKLLSNALPYYGYVRHVLHENKYNAIEILDWLKDNNIVHNFMIHTINPTSDIKLLQWFLDQNFVPNAEEIGRAVQFNRYDILDIFAKRGWLPDQRGANLANNLKMIEWLKNNGAPLPNRSAISSYMIDGNIEMLEWLYNNKIVFEANDLYPILNPTNYNRIYSKYRIPILNWFKSKGILPEKEYYSPLLPDPVLDWLRDNGLLKTY